jgi:sec-independent protein translocase protein TatC
MTNDEITRHLIELRKRLIWIIAGYIFIFLCLAPFANHLYNLLSSPLLTYLPHGTQVVAIDVISPFFVPLKLVVLIALVISLPNICYQIWCFIAPALYRHEQRLFLGLSISVISLFMLGVLFCYFIVLPALFGFIAHIKASQITMMTDINNYLNFVLTLFTIFGICFQMPVIIFLLLRFKIVTVQKMRKLRPYMFVLCFVIAAIVTPPDVLSQTLLALPLYLLYELGILFGD